jgi:hypothetical protein
MFGRFAKIISFPAYHKTQVLGAEKLKTVNTKGVVRLLQGIAFVALISSGFIKL